MLNCIQQNISKGEDSEDKVKLKENFGKKRKIEKVNVTDTNKAISTDADFCPVNGIIEELPIKSLRNREIISKGEDTEDKIKLKENFMEKIKIKKVNRTDSAKAISTDVDQVNNIIGELPKKSLSKTCHDENIISSKAKVKMKESKGRKIWSNKSKAVSANVDTAVASASKHAEISKSTNVNEMQNKKMRLKLRWLNKLALDLNRDGMTEFHKETISKKKELNDCLRKYLKNVDSRERFLQSKYNFLLASQQKAFQLQNYNPRPDVPKTTQLSSNSCLPRIADTNRTQHSWPIVNGAERAIVPGPSNILPQSSIRGAISPNNIVPRVFIPQSSATSSNQSQNQVINLNDEDPV